MAPSPTFVEPGAQAQMKKPQDTREQQKSNNNNKG